MMSHIDGYIVVHLLCGIMYILYIYPCSGTTALIDLISNRKKEDKEYPSVLLTPLYCYVYIMQRRFVRKERCTFWTSTISTLSFKPNKMFSSSSTHLGIMRIFQPLPYTTHNFLIGVGIARISPLNTPKRPRSSRKKCRPSPWLKSTPPMWSI